MNDHVQEPAAEATAAGAPRIGFVPLGYRSDQLSNPCADDMLA